MIILLALQTTDKKRRSISKAAGSPWRSQLAALPHSDKPQKVKPLFASTSALAFDNTNRDIQEEEEEGIILPYYYYFSLSN